MKVKRVIRYYSDCGRGFWKKQKAIKHDINCKCWRNTKFRCCISCKHKLFYVDSNGMEHEPHNYETWQDNACIHIESGVPVHEDFYYIRKYCSFYEIKLMR